ncbi:MAG: hypothetical protein IID12_07520 [Candidatus Marinimicrobia bacterium]|nr:hypothetical protein [Candidatus Neomarinimicrobiota bacterium]
MKNIKNRIFALLLLSILLLHNGCTLIGYAIGSEIDARNTKKVIIDRENYKNFNDYQEILVTQNNQSTKTGKFIDLTEDEITLSTLLGFESIKLNDIARIEVDSKKTAIFKGLGIGIVFDIAYAIWLNNKIKEIDN